MNDIKKCISLMLDIDVLYEKGTYPYDFDLLHNTDLISYYCGDLFKIDSDGRSLLHVFSMYNLVDLKYPRMHLRWAIRTLLENGLDPTLLDNMGLDFTDYVYLADNRNKFIINDLTNLQKEYSVKIKKLQK